MKLAILSTGPQLYSTRRLVDAARRRGHRVDVLDTLRFTLDVAPGQPSLRYNGQAVAGYDAILPRIGTSISYFGTAVVRQFEQLGVHTMSTALAIANARDKWRSLQILSRHDLGIPPTTFVRDRRDAAAAIARVGGPPVIVKLLEGTQGVGVVLAERQQTGEAMIETLVSAGRHVLVQQFIPESKGRDIRAFVVGHRVVAAMRRLAQGDEFRANIHRGGRAEIVDLDARQLDTAVRAAKIMGLGVAGVDMLESRHGPLVLEVNSSPGLEGIETTTGIDIAGRIIDELATQVEFAGIDVRQRLTPDSGYGIAEITISKGLGMVGRTINGSRLRDRELRILALHRGPRTITNPAGDLTLEADDRLLCFGRLESMRGLVAARNLRRGTRTSSWS